MSDVAPPSKRSRTLRGLYLLAFLGLVAGAAVGWQYHEHVVKAPGEHLAPTYIRGVIAQESPVFFRDGVTRVGVFFDDEHRSYVGWEALPRAYVAGIVAAEDDRFWSHGGFDLWHIGRAMRDNLAAGRLVAGGSTLTQQTAKNLYYRPDRSLRAKLIEGLNALRLEAHYSKTEILTFYANQFHVSGNGRGLGIAARYFFDKDVDALTLVENAFLAGMVKAPSHVDPFLGDEARRERARKRGEARTRYVLERIVDEPAEKLAGPYPPRGDVAAQAAFEARVAEVSALQREASEQLASGIRLAFKRGAFRYDASAVLDEVARRLAEPPFDDVLAKAGIDDPATAGLQVVTTLDADVQRTTQYGLWHHLTDVGVMLEARGREAFILPEARAPRFDPDAVPQAGTFRTARVQAVVESDGRKHLEVDLGGHPCIVDRTAMVRAAVAIARGEAGDPHAKVPGAVVNALADTLGPGTVVWTSVRATDEAVPRCDLEVRPELQGAAVVLHHGEVLAMVGGNDNRNFNRATALRQFGSTWKPLVFHAAMALGWSPLDPLDNRPAAFPFSTTFYWPSADHRGEDTVSMAWAGVRSENLASVWLLYHLTDRLTQEELGDLAAKTGLARTADETAEAYRARIQEAGVLPLPSRAREATFLRARAEVVAAMPDDQRDEAMRLQSMLFGFGFEAERRRVAGAEQRAILDRSWLATEARATSCRQAVQAAIALVEVGVMPQLDSSPVSFAADGRWVRVACGTPPDDGQDWGPPTPEMFERPGFFAPAPQLAPAREAWVDGRLRLGTIEDVADAMQRRALVDELAESRDLYDPDWLYWHQDFRVLVGMRYVVQLAERFGVRTEVDAVMSLPLGATEITLEEAAMVYDGITTGRTWSFVGQSRGPEGPRPVAAPLASSLLIAELRDVDGQVLYRARPVETPVTDPTTGALTADILRNVVRHGTARRAADGVTLAGAPLPIGGKTGTTNAFRNAAFLGVVPQVEAGVVVDHVTVGVYVGYDDNRSMVHRRIKLAGSSGALPAWTNVASGVVAAGWAGDGRAPDAGWRVTPPEGVVAVDVDATGQGTHQAGGGGAVWVRDADAPRPQVLPPSSGWRRLLRVAPRTDGARGRDERRTPFRLWPGRARQGDGP